METLYSCVYLKKSCNKRKVYGLYFSLSYGGAPPFPVPPPVIGSDFQIQ
jgi:hypothetical protein